MIWSIQIVSLLFNCFIVLSLFLCKSYKKLPQLFKKCVNFVKTAVLGRRFFIFCVFINRGGIMRKVEGDRYA